MNITKSLKKYLEREIMARYSANDMGHGISHIMYVIDRSLKFAKQVKNINYDMVYTIAIYHDIGHSIDAENHEEVSAKLLFSDSNLKKYFTLEEITIMSEAVIDHRASLEYEPRSIYGKIISSADRNVSIDEILKRTYSYRINKFPNDSLEKIIEDSKRHIKEKFGPNGYANNKMYFKDNDYDNFLIEVGNLLKDNDKFRKKYIEVNLINKKDK